MSEHEREILEQIESQLEGKPRSPRRRSRRKRLMKKVAMGGMMVLAGAGARQSGLVDLSPSHTTQLATLGPISEREGDRVISMGPEFDPEVARLLTPEGADAEARATPTRIERASEFNPADFENRAGRVHQTGEASFYGAEFAGRRTANGERFDPDALTAAHKTLPLGSVIRVTNTASGDSVVVRVNDRGPYAHGRVVDLSHAAARQIGMEQSGTADVRIEVL